LREEIQDVLALVESSYLEEQRKFSEMTTFNRKKEKKQSKIRDERIAANNARFERIFVIVSFFTFPFMLMGGTLGMNFIDMPVELPFLPVLGVTLSFSTVLLIAFFLFVHEFRKPPPPLDTVLPTNRFSFSLDIDRPGFLNDRFSLEAHMQKEAVEKLSMDHSLSMRGPGTVEKNKIEIGNWEKGKKEGECMDEVIVEEEII